MAGESLRLARTSDDQFAVAEALQHEAQVRSRRGDPAAEVGAREALAIFRAMDNRFGIARVLQNLAVMEVKRGDLRAARDHISECLELGETMRGPGWLHGTLFNRGLLELQENDAVSAKRTFTEALTVAGRVGARPNVAFALLGLSFCAAMTHEQSKAATLHGAADHCFQTLGESLDSTLDGYRMHDQRRLRTEMGDLAFDAAYSSGLSLTQDEAVDLALTQFGD